MAERELAQQALAAALPKAMQAVGRIQRTKRGPIRLRAMGKTNVRVAILMGEVLTAPRAFDI